MRNEVVPLDLVVAVITCFNEKESVLRCIRQLQSTDPDIRVVLIDDGSSDGTSDDVTRLFPETVVVDGDGSLWWSGATNLGIARAIELGATKVLFFNNDCITPSSGIGPMLAACDVRSKTIVSAAIGDLADGSPVSFGGQITSRGLEYIQQAPSAGPDGLATVDWLPGHAVVVPVELFSQIGNCDAKAFPQYFGDADFFFRARRVGYRLTVMPDIMVLNDRSQTGIRLKRPLRAKNVWWVISHRRSDLRLVDNLRFFWRHRDRLSLRHMVYRYEDLGIAIVQEFLERTRLRNLVRSMRNRRDTT